MAGKKKFSGKNSFAKLAKKKSTKSSGRKKPTAAQWGSIGKTPSNFSIPD